MKHYWFSFAKGDENVGVCIVESDSKQAALDKIKNLGLYPENDDILCLEIPSIEDEPGMELNILYSNEDMIRMGYVAREFLKYDWKETLLQAYNHGRTIQAFHDGKWEDFVPQNQLDKPNLDVGGQEHWRIKPSKDVV